MNARGHGGRNWILRCKGATSSFVGGELGFSASCHANLPTANCQVGQSKWIKSITQ
ncbi:hypothetical protein HN873_064932, partial [Arachis hypogaea]